MRVRGALALAVALAKSERVAKVLCAPGNGGTGQGLAKVENVAVRAQQWCLPEVHRLRSFRLPHRVQVKHSASTDFKPHS